MIIKQTRKYTHGALSAPSLPENLSANCKWLGGEGYGVWFLISKPKHLARNEYRIRRYAQTDELDCDRIFQLNEGSDFILKNDFEMAYISHCQKCIVVQNNCFFVFEYIKEYEQN